MRSRMGRLVWIAPLALLGLAAFLALGGWAVRELWNWLTPPLFGWKTITFWQALGLLALCRILFGGLGGPGGPSRMRRGMHDRWHELSPEERERFRQGMRAWPGKDASPGEGQA